MPQKELYQRDPKKWSAKSSEYQLRMRDNPEWRAKRLEIARRQRANPVFVHQLDMSAEARHRRVVYTTIRRALKSGKLVRPEACQQCGVAPPLNIKGLSNLHAHHDDYSKPLEVQWLCSTCHGKTWRRL